MIDYAAMKATEVPQDALDAYVQYKGDQHAAATARDYSALSKMQAWGAFIEIQELAADNSKTGETIKVVAQ